VFSRTAFTFRVLALYGKPDAVAVVRDKYASLRSRTEVLLIYRKSGVIARLYVPGEKIVAVTPLSLCQSITYLNTETFDKTLIRYINRYQPSYRLTLKETEQPWLGYGWYADLQSSEAAR